MLKHGYWAVTFLGLIRDEIDLRSGVVSLHRSIAGLHQGIAALHRGVAGLYYTSGKTRRRGQALTACKTGLKLPLLASNPPKSHPDNRKAGQKGQNRPNPRFWPKNAH